MLPCVVDCAALYCMGERRYSRSIRCQPCLQVPHPGWSFWQIRLAVAGSMQSCMRFFDAETVLVFWTCGIPNRAQLSLKSFKPCCTALSRLSHQRADHIWHCHSSLAAVLHGVYGCNPIAASPRLAA